MEKPDQSGLDIQDNLAKNKGNLAWTSGKFGLEIQDSLSWRSGQMWPRNNSQFGQYGLENLGQYCLEKPGPIWLGNPGKYELYNLYQSALKI